MHEKTFYPYQHAVFIGRFQPFHNGHLNTVRLGLVEAQHVIIVLGSAFAAPAIRNPWSIVEREQMIRSAFTSEELERIKFVAVRDRLYQDERWYKNVLGEVEKVTNEGDSIVLIGHHKDLSSYYLAMFPHWNFIETGNYSDLNSTNIRNHFFLSLPANRQNAFAALPHGVVLWLKDYESTEAFQRMQQEFLCVQKSKESWQHSPYPPIFTAVNALISCGGYILLVERKHAPGKNLLALPGGYLEEKERIFEGILRETYEETELHYDREKLKASLVTTQVFDYPERSALGRVIAHVGAFHLESEGLPRVQGGDDALSAQWYLMDDILCLEERIFADHYQIIQCLLPCILSARDLQPAALNG